MILMGVRENVLVGIRIPGTGAKSVYVRLSNVGKLINILVVEFITPVYLLPEYLHIGRWMSGCRKWEIFFSCFFFFYFYFECCEPEDLWKVFWKRRGKFPNEVAFT